MKWCCSRGGSLTPTGLRSASIGYWSLPARKCRRWRRGATQPRGQTNSCINTPKLLAQIWIEALSSLIMEQLQDFSNSNDRSQPESSTWCRRSWIQREKRLLGAQEIAEAPFARYSGSSGWKKTQWITIDHSLVSGKVLLGKRVDMNFDTVFNTFSNGAPARSFEFNFSSVLSGRGVRDLGPSSGQPVFASSVARRAKSGS
jgi:hypothetical protein